jgi:hypothetical protein
MKNNFIISKRSQLTLIVILVLIIVASVIIAMILIKKPSAKILPEENPEAFIQQCAMESLNKNEALIIEGNLYPNKTSNTFLYMQKVIPYLCKGSQFYYPCINQEPLLMTVVEKKFKNLTEPEVQECFNKLVLALKEKGYEVEEGKLENKIELKRGFIALDMEKRMTTKRGSEIKTYTKFLVEIESPLYRLVDTARNIVNYESTLCEFDTVSWGLNYRDLSIGKFVASDGTKVYTITDKSTGKEINFAVKTCALPAGI